MKNLILKFLSFLNLFVPKKNNKVIFVPFPNSESGSISVANQLCRTLADKKVYFVIEDGGIDPSKLLHHDVNLVKRKRKLDFYFLFHLMTSKYVFFTHGLLLNNKSKNQIQINLWHGLLYKNIVMLLGNPPIISDFVVGTSDLSKTMFSKAFGVKEEAVTLTGYPRNDYLFNTNLKENDIVEKLDLDYKPDRIILWMPTYRKSVIGDLRVDGVNADNPFCINNFNIDKFNKILVHHNSVCFVKPHPMAEKNILGEQLTNIIFIDDEWINNKNLTLYEFVSCTDILVSDVSSIMIDYILLDNPVICISEDFDEYRKSRGFYFHDIEDKIPSQIIKNQYVFFDYLDKLLQTGIDPCENKRLKLKDEFFKYQDGNSTKRLIDLVFKN